MSVFRNGYPWRLLRPVEAIVTESRMLAFAPCDLCRARATGFWVGKSFFGRVTFQEEPEPTERGTEKDTWPEAPEAV